MTQGLNLRVNLIHLANAADDSVGGSILTGTVVYSNKPASIVARRPSQASLEQGLEVDAIYDLTLGCSYPSIRERDLVEVTCPSQHPLYGLQFRITGIQPSKRTNARTHMTLSRYRYSRRQQ